MKAHQLFSLLGQVDPALVEDAAEAFEHGTVLQTSKKKRSPARRWMTVAASLLLAVGVIFAARCLILRFGGLPGQTVIDTNAREGGFILPGSHKPEAPPLPWAECFTYKVYTERESFAPGKPVTVRVEVSLTGDLLTAGELCLTVTGASPDLALSCAALPVDGDSDTVKIGRIGRQYTAQSPLCFDLTLTPTYDDWASGQLGFALLYIPDDPQDFLAQVEKTGLMESSEGWQEVLFAGNRLRLSAPTLYYAADRVETRVRATSSPMGLLNDMLIAHYRSLSISGREFSRIFYEEFYRDSICAAVDSYMTEAHTVKYTYAGRNIRYSCRDFVRSEDMYETAMAIQEVSDWNSDEYETLCRRLAQLALADMRDRGVITQDEYASETAYLDACATVNNFRAAFPQGLDGLGHRVVQKYGDTHRDP